MHELLQNCIGGEWGVSGTGRTSSNINPATGEVLGAFTVSDEADVDRAVAAASAAFPAWRATPAPKRAHVVLEAWRLLGERAKEVATALTLEEGKVFAESMGEVTKSRSILEFMAGEGRRLNGETIPSELPNTFAWTQLDPLGVVGLITPWNFPIAIPFWKIAPAIVSGNTCVFKPAEQTPWTGDLVTRIFQDAGLPAGVLNLVHGFGEDCGDRIVRHPEVKAISFTGSNPVGTHIYATAAAQLKKVQCEMGGKNPIIVMEDADLELAIASAAAGAFASTGQRCTATSRAIVHEDVVEAFVAGVQKKAVEYRPGPGMDSQFNVGPVVDSGQFETVMKYIEIGKSEARLVTGGFAVTDGACAGGHFVAPTLFTDVAPDARIAQEEIFGPVLSVISVKSLDEALEVANSVEYGLSSSLYTQDVNRVFRYMSEVETGITHINSATVGGEAHVPFGGMKATGVGAREMGKTAIEFFTEVKSCYVDYTGTLRTGHTY